MSANNYPIRIVLTHVLVGILVGVVILHPITMGIYGLEHHVAHSLKTDVWTIFGQRALMAFAGPMMPMLSLFGVLGGSLGLGSGLYFLRIVNQQKKVSQLEQELQRNISTLITLGESQTLEFKSSLRWDYRQEKVNKQLEFVIVKTIAGFFNHKGGSLLVGIDDGGEILGLDKDYSTLKQKNKDGFELSINGLIKSHMGGDLCPFVQSIFHRIDEKDLCQILVEPSDHPVYVQQSGKSLYFVRTGNATRELDTREAVEHIKRRYP